MMKLLILARENWQNLDLFYNKKLRREYEGYWKNFNKLF